MSDNLFSEEQTHERSTRKHRQEVAELLADIARELITRGNIHDDSKLEGEERAIFERVSPQLRRAPYLSDAYKAMLAELGPALESHYALNRHHPEHFAGGVADMNLIDVIEMIADWTSAARQRSATSATAMLPKNVERFGIEPQLARIIENTLGWLDRPREV